jgi:hypothetical protein
MRYPAEGDRIAETYEFACGSFCELVGDEWEFRQTDGCEIAKLSRDLDAANKENAALTAEVERLKSLPADTRWEELRAYIRSLRPDAVTPKNGIAEGITTVCDLITRRLDRLAAAPAEANDVPNRPPMLLASIGDGSRDVWWTRQGDDLWESQRVFGVATHSASAGLFVDRNHSDLEALSLYDQDMAEAKYAGPRQEVNPYLDYLFHKPECGCELCIQWHEDFPAES